MNEKDRPTYQAFLLRLWSEDREAPWRFTLEQARNGERRHFASVQQLGAYLETLTEDANRPVSVRSQDDEF